MMKNNILSLCLMLALTACTSQPKPQKDSALPILDISKEYPEIELDIHEIADVEYIPLETTDESIIGKAPYFAISEKYIVSLASTLDKTTRFFDRKGKYLFKIDRCGQGPEEYVTPYNGKSSLI